MNKNNSTPASSGARPRRPSLKLALKRSSERVLTNPELTAVLGGIIEPPSEKLTPCTR
jgi:hypothetical protein